MRARHVCAVAGVAIAAGLVVFVNSLAKTNSFQSLVLAEALLASSPVESGAKTAMLSPDYRPGGIPLQGPPLRALVATREGDTIPEGGIVVSRALFAQRRLQPPRVGEEMVFSGRRAAYRLKVAGILDWNRPVRGYPNAFVSTATAASIGEAWSEWHAKNATDLAEGFANDAQRNFSRAQPLMFWAALFAALALVANSILLSIEAKRREIAMLRTLGLTRLGVVAKTCKAALLQTLAGVAIGGAAAYVAVVAYVVSCKELFPAGMAFSWRSFIVAAGCAVPVALAATLAGLRAALAVKPLEAASRRVAQARHLPTLAAFAFGFGAFVAVEVWGASLMHSFVPSREWPDAIVSILPAGVSSFEIEKLQGKLEGVARIHELSPLQLDLLPKEELKSKGSPDGPVRGKAYRNALLLASDWLPSFRFVAGDWESAERLLRTGDNCIITEMMARARKLKLGDEISLDCTRGLTNALKVVGIVDLNWHLVTSRALVRGLNRMPVDTDGPLFVGFDTLEAMDARPAPMVNMTHLWLEYEPGFLASNGVFAAGRKTEAAIVNALGGADLLSEDRQVRGNSVQLHARDEIADGTLAHGDDLIGEMARVPYIFLAVVSLAFVPMLVASADARRRQFLVLRAIGATRAHIARLLVREALAVAAGGVIVGGLCGALAGWLFTAVTRATMANWGLPPAFAVPYGAIVRGALGAVAFALVIAVPTSIRLMRGRPAAGE